MDDGQSLGGARPGGSKPVLRDRTIHDIAKELNAPYESIQTAYINKGSGADPSRDGPPSPKRRKVCGASYSKPSHRSTKRNSGIGNFDNADSFGSPRFSPSGYNLRDYNRRKLDPADLGGRSSKTTTLNGAPGSKGALSSFNSNSHNLDPASFDNDNSAEEDAAPLRPTIQPQRGRKSGRLMAAGKSHPRSLNPVRLDDDNDSDTEDEDDASSELAAKIQSPREPESLTAIQLAAKAGLGGNSRLALLLKSRGRDDTATVCRGGWNGYKPPKAPKTVVKRPRGRPRIHPEGQSKRSKKKFGIHAGQQPSLTAQSGAAKTSSQELGSSASTAAGVDPSSDMRSMHLRSSSSIRVPARYSDVSFTTTKDDTEEDELAGKGPKPQGHGYHSASHNPRRIMSTKLDDLGPQSEELNLKRHYTRHVGARPPGRRANSAVAQKSSGSMLAMTEPADLDEGFQGLERQQVSTLVVFSKLPGKGVREAEDRIKAANRSHQKGRSGVRPRPFGAKRKSSGVKKSSGPIVRPYAGKGLPTMPVSKSVSQDSQDAEKQVRETRSRTLRSSTAPSSAGRKSQDVQKSSDSVAPRGHGKSPSTVAVHGGLRQEPGNKVIATPKVSRPPQASGYTTPATPEVRNLRQRPGDKVSLSQPKGPSKRKNNVEATATPISDTASTVPATAQVGLSAQEKGWITRRAAQAGQSSARKADQKKGQKANQKKGQKANQKKSSSVAATDTQSKRHK